ncbi:MAG: CHAT domain-containing protein [Lapillicoccus sp.]
MPAREYENFDLLVETLGDGSYRSRVTASPVGVGASATFAMPFDPTALENLLLKLDPGRSQMRRATADPRPQASTDLGGGLFDAVFGEEVLLAWSRSLDTTRSAGEGLRVRLQLTDAPQLAGLPWELLWDRRSHTYLAQSERTPVVRYLEVTQPPRPLVVDGPLRILVVLSSPTDLPELDVEAEWRRLQDGLADRVAAGLVHLDRLPTPTTTALAAWLRGHEVHILHVIGHGDYDEQQQEGVLYFCDAYGRSVAVPPGVLGPYLHDHDPLRLVFLNACQSGRLGAADPFSGMAQRLVQQDCTAVVAMQFPISDGAATAFTGEFYAALADGMPVDQATTSARKALLAGYASEWATPVLYLNAPDGRVFASITPPAAAPVPAPAAPAAQAAPVTAVAPPVVPPAPPAASCSRPHRKPAPSTTNHRPGRPPGRRRGPDAYAWWRPPRSSSSPPRASPSPWPAAQAPPRRAPTRSRPRRASRPGHPPPPPRRPGSRRRPPQPRRPGRWPRGRPCARSRVRRSSPAPSPRHRSSTARVTTGRRSRPSSPTSSSWATPRRSRASGPWGGTPTTSTCWSTSSTPSRPVATSTARPSCSRVTGSPCSSALPRLPSTGSASRRATSR